MEKKYLTLNEILKSDEATDLYVEALDRWVKIKNASTKDRLEAEKLASKHPSWDQLSQDDKSREIGKMLALMILVEPKISYEQYLESDDIRVQILLNAVGAAYIDKLIKLTEKHNKAIRDFLQQQMVKDQSSSIIFSGSETMNGNQQQKSI